MWGYMGWVRDYLRNVRQSELPLSRRLALIARNYGRRIVLRQACCGHPGEPGC